MNVIEALEQRKSTRAFLSKEVEREKINTILDAARHAPSGTNTQPWQVAVVTGEAKINLQSKIEAAFRSGDKGKADYRYYPEVWTEPYASRRKECGLLMYKTLGITREDKERQVNQWAANYRAFGAPVMLLFFMDDVMQTGSYIDYGMFLQSVMLVAVDQGLATCPQAAIADYPEIIKAELGYSQETVLLCGMALGYEDKDALVNSYRTSREDVKSFTRYFK
jgi:nitroreductase